MYKILIVDDDKEASEFYAIALKFTNFIPIEATTGEEALELVKIREIDLIVLDKILPGISGFKTCQILKSDKMARKIPIIMITGENELPMQKVRAFEIGADDYLSKPIDPAELIVRIKRSLKREKSKMPGLKKILTRGELNMNIAKKLVTVKDKYIPLTTSEFKLLYMLVEEPGVAVSRNDILNCVGGLHAQKTKSVDVYVHRLKKKLGKLVKDRIVPVSKFGYKWA